MNKQKAFAISVVLLFVIVIPLLNIYFHTWRMIGTIYVASAIAFFAFTTTLYLIVTKNPKTNGKDPTMKYSVIIPCYNEEANLLKACAESMNNLEGTHQTIIVDDGSTKAETKKALDAIEKQHPNILIIRQAKNKGKKFVQAIGVENAKYDYIISTDSDTIFKPDAGLLLVTPLKNPKIGLTNSTVELKNPNDNIVTKMQQLQNYSAFMIGRKTTGGLGILNCASGIGLAFRKKDYLAMKEEYLGKRPYGFDCKFGEDRYMTNLTLKKGQEAVFIEEAVAYSEFPNKLKGWLKQQLRWRISGFIETIHALSYSWKRSKTLWFYNLGFFILPYLCISLIITMIAMAIYTGQYHAIPLYIIVVIMATFVRNTIIITKQRQLVKYIIPFTIINMTALLWLYIIAPFRINEQTWITR